MSFPLSLRAICLSLSGRLLFTPVSLDVGAGRVFGLVAPSGGGKSSLLAFLCGFLDPAFRAQGRILTGSRDITRLPPESRGLAILFQDDLLFPHLSVGGNLAFGLPRGLSREERRERIARALRAAEMQGFEKRDPATLSGGQKARIALLRALLSAPRALLLDEAFAKLDPPLRMRFQEFVLHQVRRLGIPVLTTGHSPQDLEGFAESYLTLEPPCSDVASFHRARRQARRKTSEHA